jgi:hypothetical protein
VRIDDDGATWLCHRCEWRGGIGPDREQSYRCREKREAPPDPEQYLTLAPWGLDLWEQCSSILPGTPAATYLDWRCCIVPPGDLRWHADLVDRASGYHGPAMVGLVTDVLTGEPMNLHRTWLAPDGRGKAPIDKPRRRLRGHRSTGVIRLWPDSEVTMGIAVGDGREAIECSGEACFDALWGETEDPAEEVLKPRLVAAGADCRRITFITPKAFAEIDRRKFIKQRSTKLIVLSPFLSYLEGLQNINAELEVRGALEKLLADIAGTGCALLGVAHANKKADLAAIERIIGSVAFTNFVRSVLLIAPNKHNDEEASHRLVHAKHNLSIKGDDLLFTPRHVGEDPTDQFVKLDWSVPVNGNIDADAMFDRGKPHADGKAKRFSKYGARMYVSQKIGPFSAVLRPNPERKTNHERQ